MSSTSISGQVSLKVKSTGETIKRTMIDRSGYRVVRYRGQYHIVRGTGNASPYIIGQFNGDDALGTA